MLSSASTFLYFEQLHIVSETFKGAAQRTQVFAAMDAIVQTATLLLQLFVTGRIATHLGITTRQPGSHAYRPGVAGTLTNRSGARALGYAPRMLRT